MFVKMLKDFKRVSRSYNAGFISQLHVISNMLNDFELA